NARRGRAYASRSAITAQTCSKSGRPSTPLATSTCQPGWTSTHVSTSSRAYCSSRGSIGRLLQHALRERDDQHFARGLLQDVLDCRREEARLAPPARRGAEDDQVGARAARLLHDRLADRARTHGRAANLDAVVGAQRTRLLERLRGARLLLGERRVE